MKPPKLTNPILFTTCIPKDNFEVRVSKGLKNQKYALYMPGTVNPTSAWNKSEQYEQSFHDIKRKVEVVTQKSESSPLPSMTVQADGYMIKKTAYICDYYKVQNCVLNATVTS